MIYSVIHRNVVDQVCEVEANSVEEAKVKVLNYGNLGESTDDVRWLDNHRVVLGPITGVGICEDDGECKVIEGSKYATEPKLQEYYVFKTSAGKLLYSTLGDDEYLSGAYARDLLQSGDITEEEYRGGVSVKIVLLEVQ